MCEANVYICREGQEDLLMRGVDRIVPGDDNNIFMENIFGERRVVKARIKEMELVHHRILLEEIPEVSSQRHLEMWLEPDTDHGHFHPGEPVRVRLFKGYNMRPDKEAVFSEPTARVLIDGESHELTIVEDHGEAEITMNQEIEGLARIFVCEKDNISLYAAAFIEVGHHHHHGVQPVGLPLEIVPVDYSHARMGENYEIQVLKDGRPLKGVEVSATYSHTRNSDYPHRLKTDDDGRASLFLTARGNYLFSVTDGNAISTFTLIKGF